MDTSLEDTKPSVKRPTSGTDSDIRATVGTSNIFLRRPAITTFVVLASFLTPVAVLPYVLTRRRVSRLSTKLDELAANHAALQKSVTSLARSAHDAARTKDELVRTTALLECARKEVHLLRRDLVRVQGEHEALATSTNNELSDLLRDRKATAERLDLLPQLGISLANIAAFMHEVGLQQGLPSTALDAHGVDRLRMFALKLQKSAPGEGKHNS